MFIMHTLYALKPLVGERRTFEATFERYGHFMEDGRRVFTACLRDLRERVDSPVVAEHTWIHSTPEWDGLGLERGDTVYFEATIRERPEGKITLCEAAPLAVRA
jgi:hypothetical protein